MVVHTYEAIDTTKDVLIALDDAETGQRGYLVSGDKRYLAPYEKAMERLHLLQNQLMNAYRTNSGQVARVKAMDQLIEKKLEELKHSISLYDDVAPMLPYQ